MRGAVSSAALLAFGLALAPALAAGPRLDPAQVVGPQECAKCHDLEHARWRETAHAKLFESSEPLHLRPQAKEIAARLKLTLIRHDSLCVDCHYTPKQAGSRKSAVAGVSCESCHGAAKPWLTVHNTFEGKQSDRLGESPAARQRREAANASAGMFARGRLYDLVSRCYDCHLVPDERLVTEGGHPSGSRFDLLERFDTIRHNFVSAGRKANAPISAERRRDLYLAGRVLELEHALRNLARARAGGDFATSQAERLRQATRNLERLGRQAPVPLVETALGVARELPGADPAPARLTAAADQIAAAARAFFSSDARLPVLAQLDGVMAGGEGSPAEAATGQEDDAGHTPTLAGGPSAPPGVAGAPAASDQPDRSTTPALQQPQGEIRRTLRKPLSTDAVVDPGNCTGCHQHAEQSRALRRHPHQQSAEAFFSRGPALDLAFVYFGKPAQAFAARGNSVCMGCHATVITGEDRDEVSHGVSCQSCHGPAGRFEKPHQRPGMSRQERLGLGMVDLQSPERQAMVCASCHYVTDPRLLASGHPSGAKFDFLAGLAKVAHWKRQQPAPAALQAAWVNELGRRGALPSVQVVSRKSEAGSSRGAVPTTASGLDQLAVVGATPLRVEGRSSAVETALPRPLTAARSSAARPRGSIALPPLPADLASRPVEEILLLLEERLRLLARALGGEP